MLEVALILLTLYAVLRDTKIRKKELSSSFQGEVTRGDKSMSALYAVYGATIASFLVLINSASGVEGNKVALVLLNFVCVTYVFFFSTWFRNSIFFPLNQRIKKD